MATIALIINFFKQLAIGSNTSLLKSFIYGDPFDVNNHRNKTYPLLLVDHNVNIDGLNLKNNHRVYTFKLFFYDVYSRKQKTERQTAFKQLDFELVAESYIKLLRKLFLETNRNFGIENAENISGFWAYHKHNDKLIQLVYTIKIRAVGGCDDALLLLALAEAGYLTSPYVTSLDTTHYPS